MKTIFIYLWIFVREPASHVYLYGYTYSYFEDYRFTNFMTITVVVISSVEIILLYGTRKTIVSMTRVVYSFFPRKHHPAADINRPTTRGDSR